MPTVCAIENCSLRVHRETAACLDKKARMSLRFAGSRRVIALNELRQSLLIGGFSWKAQGSSKNTHTTTRHAPIAPQFHQDIHSVPSLWFCAHIAHQRSCEHRLDDLGETLAGVQPEFRSFGRQENGHPIMDLHQRRLARIHGEDGHRFDGFSLWLQFKEHCSQPRTTRNRDRGDEAHAQEVN